MSIQETRAGSAARLTEDGDACVVGGGHVGHDVASKLAARGVAVSLVDSLPPHDPPPEVTVYEVTSLDSNALSDVGLTEETTVLTVGPKDSSNLLIAQVARTHFDVDRVIARVNDPRRTAAFAELGLETVEAPTVLGSVIAERW